MSTMTADTDSSLYADTGEWKLIISISKKGLKAILLSLVEPGAEPETLVSRSWNHKNEEDILRNIEDIIYDNPRILEDFATRIIIETDKVAWVPLQHSEEDDPAAEFFTTIYPASPEDIFVEYDGDKACMFTLVAGIKSFLERTLPGCRINCTANIVLNFLKKQLEERGQAASKKDFIGAIAIGNTVYTYAFRNNEFIGGAPHPFTSATDIAYYIMLLSKAYDIQPASSRILLSAAPEAASEACEILCRYGAEPEIIPVLQTLI